MKFIRIFLFATMSANSAPIRDFERLKLPRCLRMYDRPQNNRARPGQNISGVEKPGGENCWDRRPGPARPTEPKTEVAPKVSPSRFKRFHKYWRGRRLNENAGAN